MPPRASTSAAADEEERVLSHGDVVLLRSDLSILRGPHFLNDRLLAFYFAHLSSAHHTDLLLLLPPSIPYLLSNLPDPASVAAVAEPLHLSSRRLALLPVNDNPDVSLPEGGSHWSLLVMDNTSPSKPRFVHHDSFGLANFPAARRLFAALRPLLPAAPRVQLVEGPTPMQLNGYDCGVYVMAVARAICEWWSHRSGGEGDWFEAVRREADAERVEAMRGEILKLILGLMDEEKKKGSKMQNHEKVVTVKPVASRPFSSFRSFSKLLEQSSSTSSPPVSLPEVTVASRPKTTRFRSPPSDPLAEVTVTTASDVDTTNEQMAAGMDQVLSGDHLTMPHDVMKPMGSVKKHSSYDGYNWRKYGQKQVKGSEFPRSYYKCTHPSCPVKRKVERSLDGQIAEIVYNGEHNHPKPHPPKKPFSSASTETAVTEAHATDDAVVDGELGGCSCTLGYDSVVVAFRGSCSCLHGFGEMSKKGDCKKSMKGKHSCDTSALTAYVEPTPASRRLTEHEMSGDGFHWRKYGRKVVKGNSFPRSYYRCTAEKCNARKYVERASDDSGSFVTIYEGKHNHDIPT